MYSHTAGMWPNQVFPRHLSRDFFIIVRTPAADNDAIIKGKNMSRQIQIRRGSAAEHEAFTGALGEVTMDTTNKTLRVHDGETPGGIPLAKQGEGMPANADYVVASQTPTAANKHTWYRKYKSGWIEQGGISNTASIVFPVRFSNNNYTVHATSSSINPGLGTISVCYSNKETFGLLIQLRWDGAATDAERCWMASGY